MMKKLKKLTKLNLLVTISVCASTFIGAAFVYSIWNWLAQNSCSFQLFLLLTVSVSLRHWQTFAC